MPGRLEQQTPQKQLAAELACKPLRWPAEVFLAGMSLLWCMRQLYLLSNVILVCPVNSSHMSCEANSSGSKCWHAGKAAERMTSCSL